MLPSERKRRRDNAQLDAEGASWSQEIDVQARRRIVELWDVPMSEQFISYEGIGRILRSRLGWDSPYTFYPEYLIQVKDVSDAPDIVAASAESISNKYHRAVYEKNVNDILNEHRIGYKFLDGELVAYKDDELMQESVEPALRLLVGEKFSDAHQSYVKALHQISQNDNGSAITKAAAALQETLEALGCQGKQLGGLIQDAKRKGLFGPQDSPLTEGIGSIMGWVSADRNQISDSHRNSPARREDAWLVVHVVGAMIVRLAEGTSRPTPKISG